MRYLLDANTVIALLNDSRSKPAKRLRREQPGDVAISTIVVHELYYGAFKSRRRDRNLALIDALQFTTIEFDQDDAREAGRIRAFLAGQGTPIGPFDVLIAGQAVARNLVLASTNAREFSRVPGLRLDDWAR